MRKGHVLGEVGACTRNGGGRVQRRDAPVESVIHTLRCPPDQS